MTAPDPPYGIPAGGWGPPPPPAPRDPVEVARTVASRLLRALPLIAVDAVVLCLVVVAGPWGWLTFVVIPMLFFVGVLLLIGWVGLLVRPPFGRGIVWQHVLLWAALGGFYLTHSDFGDSPPHAEAPLERWLRQEAGTFVIAMWVLLLLVVLVALVLAVTSYVRAPRAYPAYPPGPAGPPGPIPPGPAAPPAAPIPPDRDMLGG